MKAPIFIAMLTLLVGCSHVGASHENRKYVARVVSYQMSCAVFDGLDPRDTVHLDCLSVRIDSPSDLRGREWQLYIHNEVWGDPVDYGYRPGDTVVIDVPQFHTSRAALRRAMDAPTPTAGFWVSHDLIKRANQSPDPTAGSVTPRAGARVAPLPAVGHL